MAESIHSSLSVVAFGSQSLVCNSPEKKKTTKAYYDLVIVPAMTWDVIAYPFAKMLLIVLARNILYFAAAG